MFCSYYLHCEGFFCVTEVELGMSKTSPTTTICASREDGSFLFVPKPLLPEPPEMVDFRDMCYMSPFIPCPSTSRKDSRFIGWPETHGLTRLGKDE